MVYYRIFKFELGWKFIMKILQRGHTFSIFCSLLHLRKLSSTILSSNTNTNAQSSYYHV